MAIEKIEMFQTSDGIRFDTIEKAELHEKRLTFIKEYESSEKLFGFDGRALNANDVLDFIIENRGKIAKLLN